MSNVPVHCEITVRPAPAHLGRRCLDWERPRVGTHYAWDPGYASEEQRAIQATALAYYAEQDAQREQREAEALEKVRAADERHRALAAARIDGR
jgi:hypothetical protein